MYCPSCESEYRPGIARCPTCDVDLVPELGAGQPSKRHDDPATPSDDGAMVGYCGFLRLDDARAARDEIRRRGIRWEIAIREAPDADGEEPAREEYWLRVPARQVQAAAEVLGFDEAHHDDAAGELRCSVCGRAVTADTTACPGCGERFED